jgi:hypothetical protein
MVKLYRGPSCPEVLGGELHMLSNVECNLCSAGVHGLPRLGFQYVLLQSPMSLWQSCEVIVCVAIQFPMGHVGYIELHAGVPMVHVPEWCHPSRSIH